MATKRIDEKHHIEALSTISSSEDNAIEIKIIKTTNGQAIPEDEPIILFRGRDKLAIAMLEVYYTLCKADGATQYQLDSMDKMINAFRKFKEDNPTTMKQPGCTLGK